jgi:hypothetical protein
MGCSVFDLVIPSVCASRILNHCLVLLDECCFVNYENLPPRMILGFARGKTREKYHGFMSKCATCHVIWKIVTFPLLHPMSPRREETGQRKKNANTAELGCF